MSSIFCHRVTRILDQIPGAPGATITIRKLNYAMLRDARQEGTRRSIQHLRASGGLQWLASERAKLSLTDETIAAKISADPLAAWWPVALALPGIVAWSFDRPVTPEAIADLEDAALTYVAREILRLTKPELFAEATC